VTVAIGVLAFLATLACLALLVRVQQRHRAQTAAIAYAALLIAAGLARTVQPVPQVLVFLLMTFAAARLAGPSFTGWIHTLLGGVAFGSIAWAAATLPDRVDWSGVHGLLVVLGWIVVAGAVACALAVTLLRTRAAPFFGTIERAFYAVLLVWFFVVSVRLALA
jgi:hypothetical protein